MTGWSPRTAMRGPERKGEAFICRYSWIPHQVRNDETAGSSEVSQTGKGLCRYTCPGTPGYRVVARYDVWCHPALRCGVQREKARHSFAGIPPARIFWIPRHTGSPRTTMRGPLVGIPGFRITPGHPAQRCGVQKSASCGYCLCRYSWIPHQVRNDETAGSSEGRRGIHLPIFLDTASQRSIT